MRIRARYLAPLLCGLAIVPLGMWHEAHQKAEARHVRWQEQVAIERSAERLYDSIDLPGGPLTLAELQTHIEKQAGLKVFVDEDLPKWVSVTLHEPIVLPEGRFPLQTVLSAALSQLDLTYDVEVDSLIITHEDVSRDSTTGYIEVYPLPLPELSPRDVDEEGWAQLVTTLTGYAGWGSSRNTYIEAAPGALVILQTPRMHRKIRRLFHDLEKLRTPPTDLAPVPLWPDSEASLNQKVVAALGQPCHIDWDAEPLDEALRHLGVLHQIPVILQTRKLQEAAVEPDTPVTKRLKDVSLRSALRLVLSELELTCLIDDGALIITTPDDANSPDSQLLVAYPVQDLVGIGPGLDYDPLIELLTTSVAPWSWDEVGGPSSLDGGPDGWLIVSQSLDVHERLEFVLAQLRRALTYDESLPVLSLAKESERERAILKKLEQEIELNDGDMPLEAAMRLLSDKLDIPIYINQRKLEEAAVPLNSTLRMTLPRGTARQQLRTLLPQLELTYLIDDEVLQITTPDDASSPDRLETRLYDIRLLTDPDFGAISATNLEELIATVIAPTTWDEVGGPGSFTLFEDVLVVTQERVWHEEMERLLTALGDHCLPARGEVHDRLWVVDPAGTEASRAIEERLHEVIDFEVDGLTLIATLEQLVTEQKLPLIVLRTQLENAGVDQTQLIRFSARGMTVSGVLDRLLEPFECGNWVRDNGLIVSSNSDASMEPTVRLYRRPVNTHKEPQAAGTSLFYGLLSEAPPWSISDLQAVTPVGHEWIALLASDALHRRVGDETASWRTEKPLPRAVERRSLDKEREATHDWQSIVPGQTITAAQRVNSSSVQCGDAGSSKQRFHESDSQYQ